MIPIKNELNSIGKNFNQAVKKLHTLNQISEFKIWLIMHERDIKTGLQKIEEIKTNFRTKTIKHPLHTYKTETKFC